MPKILNVRWSGKWVLILPRFIDPEVDGIHPLRHELSVEDWDRLDDFVAHGKGNATLEEIEAYADWLFDEMAANLQTHEGVVSLQ